MKYGYYSSLDHNDTLLLRELKDGQELALFTDTNAIALKMTHLMSPRLRPIVQQIVGDAIREDNPYYELIGDPESPSTIVSSIQSRPAQGALSVGRPVVIAVYAHEGKSFDLGSVIDWAVFDGKRQGQSDLAETKLE